VFENRVPRRLFGPKRDKVTGEWRIIYNEGHNDFYSKPNTFWVIKSRRTRWVGHISRVGERKVAYRFLMGKPEGKSHLVDPGVNGRIILRWISIIWMWGMDWIELAQDRDRWWALVNAVMNLRVP
jgi:hypothetical protein